MVLGQTPEWIRTLYNEEQQQQQTNSHTFYKGLHYSPPPSTLLTATNAGTFAPSPSAAQHAHAARATSSSPAPTLAHTPIQMPLSALPPPHHAIANNIGKYNPSSDSSSSQQRTPLMNAQPHPTHRSRQSIASGVSPVLAQSVVQEARNLDRSTHVASISSSTSTSGGTSMHSQYQQYQPSPTSANRLIPDSMLMMGTERTNSNDQTEIHRASSSSSSIEVTGVGEIGMLNTSMNGTDFDWNMGMGMGMQPTASIGDLRLSNTLADDELFMD
jgi:hypothetical protein